ncbi:hypothetical protein [Flavobacterium piscis]|uniref:Peptidase S74 domain-containing protein n=1 Tax=Flavobacterium piscis TaxID=1114874 RepID=A0ABX2XD84_9FLAO|nr:hypothetical protein [Flavobacterium piscis]OCB69714.1 hypothetical protein FLP_23865 [Flavobacterium piscis]
MGSSSLIPKADSNSGTWSSTNAYWASPLIYRTRRFPENGTGAFPFNEYGELMIQGTSHGSTYNKGISFLTWDGSGIPAQSRMRIAPNGNIGIGIVHPANKLDVNGTIHSKEVKVDMNGWSDFVFKREYNLPTLEEVEKHIADKGHLENIPSEEEVLKNGISLGQMNAKLLQKIEELTLYAIEQEKKNNKQSLRIDVLEKENQSFKNVLERLSKIEEKLK